MLTRKEYALLEDFLEDISDKYSCAGCNDFLWPESWTDDEKRSLMTEAWEDYLDPVDTESEVKSNCSMDSTVLEALRIKLAKVFTGETK